LGCQVLSARETQGQETLGYPVGPLRGPPRAFRLGHASTPDDSHSSRCYASPSVTLTEAPVLGPNLDSSSCPGEDQLAAQARGVDAYDPTTGEIRSRSVVGIARWLTSKARSPLGPLP